MENIIFLNHKQKQCGVYQYGYRTSLILKNSKEYNFIYEEVDSENELLELIRIHNPKGIFYNHHPATMGWLRNDLLKKLNKITHYGLHHEGNETFNVAFNYYVILDSSYPDSENRFSVPRPLFEPTIQSKPSLLIPIIGSFGFGFSNKGFERLVSQVNNEFDQAIIRLHIPFAFYGDRDGNSARYIAHQCKRHITKSGIELKITHDFLSDQEMLNFLSNNTINVFLYDEMMGRGLSSVIDYALSVEVPIAISNTYMFRHIRQTSPSICIEDRPLKQIIDSGSDILKQYRDKWSNANLINKYETILKNTIR